MNTIKMNCDCGKVHEVQRDSDAPKNAVSMGCNWCPICEDTAEDYYNEWYNLIDNNDDDDTDNKPMLPGDVPDNQLMLFSIADDILQNHKVKRNVSETVV